MVYTNLEVEKIVSNNPSVTEIVVPDGVTEIGELAFTDASKTLEKVVLPDSVVKIGKYAFRFCKNLKSINFPSKLEEIESGAFLGTGIKSVELPASFKRFNGFDAFASCKDLEHVVLNENIEHLGKQFIDCSSLKEISIPESLANDNFVFLRCNSLEKITLPKNMTEIPKEAFSYSSALKKIEIPAGVRKIGATAFAGAAFESIDLPAELTEIGASAFLDCKLTSIKFPKSLKKIDFNAFKGNSIQNVDFPPDIEEAGGFAGTPIKTVEVPEGVSEIGTSAFMDCKNLESIKLPKQLKYKEEKYVDYFGEEKTRNIGGIYNEAFAGCEKLCSIDLPENLKDMPDGLFKDCKSLKSVKIPADVTSIHRDVFKNCTSLEEIEIPENVMTPGYEMFAGTGIKKLNWLSVAPVQNSELHRMTKLEEAYINASSIEKDAFLTAKTEPTCPLKKLTIGIGTEKIEDAAFAYLDDLSEICIEEGNKKYAFDSGCIYAKGTKRLIRAIPVGEKDGKPFYQITDKVKAIGASAFSLSVENAIVEFKGKIEKISDMAVDGFSKSNWTKEKTPAGATGGARTVYDAMNLAQAKAEKLDTIKKVSTDAILSSAFDSWKYGYEKCNGYSPARTVYKVKLPFDASFIINMKPKPTQKDIQSVTDAMNELNKLVQENADELVLFEKVRELSINSEISLVISGSDVKNLFEFAGTSLRFNEPRTTFVSSEGVLPESFIEKDIASFFAGSNLEYQTLIIPPQEGQGSSVMNKVQISIRKDNAVFVYKANWTIFDKHKAALFVNARDLLKELLELIKTSSVQEIKSTIASDKRFYNTHIMVFSV